MDLNLVMWGFFWGGIGAASLTLGAALGLWTRPSRKVVSGLMAFGGGALGETHPLAEIGEHHDIKR